MGAHTGTGRPRRDRAGKHRRRGQALIERRDHSAPQRGRRFAVPAPSPSALVGIAVLVLIALGVVHLSGSGSAIPLETAIDDVPASAAEPPSSGPATAAPASADGEPDTESAAAAEPESETESTTEPGTEIVVHVSGAVGEPGVVRLPGRARVDDALRAAGGATEEADLSAVNLARPLADGEQIHVPVPGEEPRTLPDGPADAAAEPSDSADGAPIDLNTADAAELEELPGVGPAIAQRILEHREKNGPFTSVDGLLEVSGIGPATLEEIRGRATV